MSSEPLTTFHSFLPAFVVESIRSGDPIPTGPDSRETEGSVLFADISGFTRLTLEKAALGAAGAEQIGDRLNDWFCSMIEEVERDHGDVLDFDGDAVIAFWRRGGRHGTLEDTTAAAARCGDAILKVVTARGDLAVRVGIATGKLHFMRLGGHAERWMVTASGEPMWRMGRSARASTPGHVGCDESALPYLVPNGSVNGARGEKVEIALSRELAANYLPRVLLDRIGAGQRAWLAELRRVSIVFTILRSLDAESRSHRSALQETALSVQRHVAEQGGEVNQLLQDDTGHVLLSAFGLPTQSHEDDPARAVRAALAIEQELAALGVEYAIGVATGPAFCGTYGTPSRQRYAIVGDTVNLAARLAQTAPRGLGCDAATAAGAASSFSFEELPSVSAKGRPTAVQVWRPTRSRAVHRFLATLPGTTIVERGTELATIVERLTLRVPTQPSRPLLIQGEAGIGKTTLIGGVVSRLSAQAVRVIVGFGLAAEQSRSWHVWQPIVQQLLGIGPDAEAADLRQRTMEATTRLPGMADWTPLLGALLPLHLEESESTSRMTGAVRRGALVELLLALFQTECAKGPCVVVIDDAHWADDDSWDLVRRVVEGVSGMQLVLLTRPLGSDAPAAYADLAAREDTDHLHLGPLSSGGVEAVVGQALGVERVPLEIASFIASKGQGNPFFTRELAFALRDSGHIHVEANACRVVDATRRLHDLGMPSTIIGVVTQRLDNLPPQELLALKVGAVIGPVFRQDVLTKVYPVAASAEELDAALRDLLKRDFLHRSETSSGNEYGFDHALVQDAVYGLIPFAQRRVLHSAVAQWLESTDGGAAPENYASLAHHWRSAGVTLRAVVYLEKGGDLAILQGANREGVVLFQQALELDPTLGTDRDRSAHIHGQLGKGYYGLGQIESSLQHMARALELWRLPLPRSELGWFVRLVLEIIVQIWQMLWPFRSRSTEAKRRRQREAATLLSALGEVYYFLVQVHRMVAVELRAVNLAERAQAPEVASRPYGALGYLLGLMRLHSLAGTYFRRGKRGTDARTIAFTYVAEALYHLAFCRWSECLAHVRRGMDVATGVADKLSLALLQTIKGDVEHCAGEPERAIDSYRTLISISRTQHNAQQEIWGFTGIAESLATLRRFEEALEALNEVERRIEHADKLSVIRYLGVRAFVQLRSDRLDAASATLDQMLVHQRVTPQLTYAMLWGLAGAAQAAKELSLHSGSATARKRARRMDRTFKLFVLAFPNARTSMEPSSVAWYRPTSKGIHA